jgi:hypothetical protein
VSQILREKRHRKPDAFSAPVKLLADEDVLRSHAGWTTYMVGLREPKELTKSSGRMPIVSFFFCQAPDNATAVSRGLIYISVHQQPSLLSHFHGEYDIADKNLFEEENVCVALARILRSILEDPLLKRAHIIVDAVDECSVDHHKLVDFVIAVPSMRNHMTWIVSSRAWPNIERASNDAGRTVRLSLESNEDSISTTAINTYIHS